MEADFTITVVVDRKKFRMQVVEIYRGESLEQFKVVGGERYIILQSNRPMVERAKTKQPITWKILEGDITTGDPKQIAAALNEIIIALESKIKEVPLQFVNMRSRK